MLIPSGDGGHAGHEPVPAAEPEPDPGVGHGRPASRHAGPARAAAALGAAKGKYVAARQGTFSYHPFEEIIHLRHFLRFV